MLKWKEEYTYEGGCPAVCLYNTGSMVADDSRGATADDSPMLLVTRRSMGHTLISCAEWVL